DPVDEWLYEIRKRNEEFSWIHHFVVLIDKLPIGFCQFYDCYDANGLEDWYDITTPKEVYSLDYLIGEEEFLNKGYGKDIIKQLELKIISLCGKKIIVNPDSDNEKSIGVLKANGFNLSNDGKYYYKILEAEIKPKI
ncbi:MAG: acetyltransferase, partial [Clostridiales bacterium]|nr:acetyltransferase [Clostridiales bacterium]